MNVLEVRDVYRFHEADGVQVPVLRGVSFDLTAGEFCTIMGPSGSGKSTLLHILAGLDLPSAGDVVLDGSTLNSISEEHRTRIRRQHIGFIFQFFNLLPDLTVLENITLPLLIAGERPESHRERVSELIDLLQLGPLQKRLPRRRRSGLTRSGMTAPAAPRRLVASKRLDSLRWPADPRPRR